MKKEGLYINMTSGHVEVVKNFIPEDPPVYSQSQVDYLVALEREACAKVCDARTGEPGWCCADAIRAMGEK